jgi:L-alanine-DL-glutamate epimerase-like enolase superfamily enzyme
MKIVSIETIPIALPYDSGAAPLPLGGKPRTNMESLLVKVTTDSGVTGWGDAFGVRIWPVTRLLIDRLVAPLCMGEDALQRDGILDKLDRTLYHFGRAGPLQYARSAIDIALWDIAGKAANLPVHALIGPLRTAAIPVYASLLPYRDPALAARFAARAVQQGYRYVKLHERDVASVRESRAAIGNDVGLMVDLNCPFDLGAAERFAHDVAAYDPMWLEEPLFPVDDFTAMAELARRIDTPLAMGENVGNPVEFRRVMDSTGIAYAQPSVIKTGGITALLEVARDAAQRQIRLMPHSAYFGPGLLATMHVLATLGDPILERFYCEMPVELSGAATLPRNGIVHVPDVPGLGFDPDPEVLRKYAATE